MDDPIAMMELMVFVIVGIILINLLFLVWTLFIEKK